MNALTTQHALRIVHAVAPGNRLLSSTPAAAAYTNSVHILHCVSPSGNETRLAVKRMTDDPDPERATADFHGLRIAQETWHPRARTAVSRQDGRPARTAWNRDRLHRGRAGRPPGGCKVMVGGHRADAAPRTRRKAVRRGPQPHIRRQMDGPVLSQRQLARHYGRTPAYRPDLQGRPGAAGRVAPRPSRIPPHGLLARQHPLAPGPNIRPGRLGRRLLWRPRAWT